MIIANLTEDQISFLIPYMWLTQLELPITTNIHNKMINKL